MLARHALPASSPETHPVHADLPCTLPSLYFQPLLPFSTFHFPCSAHARHFSHKPCICHTSGKSPVTPIIATDPKTPSRKSFDCHTYDPLPLVLTFFSPLVYPDPIGASLCYPFPFPPSSVATQKPRKPSVRNQSTGLASARSLSLMKTRHYKGEDARLQAEGVTGECTGHEVPLTGLDRARRLGRNERTLAR